MFAEYLSFQKKEVIFKLFLILQKRSKLSTEGLMLPKKVTINLFLNKVMFQSVFLIFSNDVTCFIEYLILQKGVIFSFGHRIFHISAGSNLQTVFLI